MPIKKSLNTFKALKKLKQIYEARVAVTKHKTTSL